MPRGSHHRETGLLCLENGQVVLARDEGGRWRLNADHSIRAWLGRRIAIDGVRTGFDVLTVNAFGSVSDMEMRG